MGNSFTMQPMSGTFGASKDEKRDTRVDQLSAEDFSAFKLLVSATNVNVSGAPTGKGMREIIEGLLKDEAIPLAARSCLAEHNWFFYEVKEWGYQNFYGDYLSDLCRYSVLTQSHLSAAAQNPHYAWDDVDNLLGDCDLSYSAKNDFIASLNETVCTEEFLTLLVQNMQELDLNEDIVLAKIRRVLKIEDGIPDAWVWKLFNASMEV
jgi:hypothetical protein